MNFITFNTLSSHTSTKTAHLWKARQFIDDTIMNTIIEDLQSPMIKTYLKEQHVDHVWLVGSFSRGEEHDDSDIDLLFQFNNTKDLDRSIYTIPETLSKELGKKVDMLDIDYLNRHIADQILSDKIAVW